MTDNGRPPPTYFGAPPRTLELVITRTVAHGRALAGLVARTASAWAHVARRLLRLRLERRKLEQRQKELQYALGGAALDENEDRVQVLRADVRACIAELRRNESDRRAVVAWARGRAAEERAAAARTRILAGGRAEVGDPGFEPGTSALSERRSNQLS